MSTPVTAKLRRGKGVGKSGVSKQGGPCPHECGPTETSPHECGPTGDRFAGIGAYGFKKVQVALLAALVTEDPLPKVALVACMRKLLTILNAVVRSGKPWNEALHRG